MVSMLSSQMNSSADILLVAFGLRHNLEAFIFAKGADGAEVEFGIMNNWVNIMKTVDFVGQTAVGDAILVSIIVLRSFPISFMFARSIDVIWSIRSGGQSCCFPS